MTTLTAVAGGGNWSSAATWSPAQVPTAADDVILASTSGNVTVDVNSACRSLDCQATGNYAGTLTHNAVTLSIGDATAGTGNRALRLSSAMTYTTVSFASSIIQFVSTSATVQTVTSAGKVTTMPNYVFNGVGGSWQLADALGCPNGTLELRNGTLNTNGQAVTCTSFQSSNSNTRTLTLGSSTITCAGTGTSPFAVSTTTGLTITANTATIVLSGSTAQFSIGNSFNMNGASVSFTGSGITAMASCTVANLSLVGTAAKNDGIFITGNITVTGTLTVTGNSAEANRYLLYGNVAGTQRTITAANVVLSNADFMDIVGAGAASWTGTQVGDAGGNSGITFTAQRTLYRVGAGNWSDTNWSLTSGGAVGQNPPLPQDNVVLNAATGAVTVTIDMPRACRDLTCTGFTGTLNQSTNVAIFGSFTGSSSATGNTGGAALYFSGRGSHTITPNGWLFAGAFTVSFLGVGGTYTLGGACTFVSANMQLNCGTLSTAGFSLTCASMNQGTAVSPTLNLASSTFTLTGTGSVMNSPSLTLNAGTSTIVLTDTSASTKTFAGGGKVYNNLVIQGGALNSVAITGNNTFANINAGPGTVVTPTSGSTQTITGALNLIGAKYDGLKLPGVTGNYASSPDAAPLRLTGDFEIVCRFTVGAVGTYQGLVARLDGPTGSGRAYAFRLALSGYLELLTSTDGSAVTNFNAAFAPVVGTTYWLKVTYTTNDGAGNRKATFYSAPDQAAEPSSWTNLGASTNAGTTATNAGTFPLVIGSDSYAARATTGAIYRAIIRNGIAGTTVFDADFTAKPWGANSFVESSSNAATVTINGDLAKAGDGRVLLNSSTPGTKATVSAASGTINGDYLVVVDSTATGGAVFNAGVRSFVTSSTGWNATGTLTRTACALHSLTGRSAATKAMTMSALAVTPATGRAAATKACNIAAKAAAAHLGSATTAKAATLGAKGPHAIAGGVGKRYAWWKVIEGGS